VFLLVIYHSLRFTERSLKCTQHFKREMNFFCCAEIGLLIMQEIEMQEISKIALHCVPFVFKCKISPAVCVGAFYLLER